MAVPQYCRTRSGSVYRIQRSSASVGDDCMRYTLRAVPVRAAARGFEVSSDVHAELIRDKIRHRQSIPTPEATFESLWHRLRLDIDAA